MKHLQLKLLLIIKIDVRYVLFTSDDLLWGDAKAKNHFLVPKKIELSDVNKTFIDIGNGQKFELLDSLQIWAVGE